MSDAVEPRFGDRDPLDAEGIGGGPEEGALPAGGGDGGGGEREHACLDRGDVIVSVLDIIQSLL